VANTRAAAFIGTANEYDGGTSEETLGHYFERVTRSRDTLRAPRRGGRRRIEE